MTAVLCEENWCHDHMRFCKNEFRINFGQINHIGNRRSLIGSPRFDDLVKLIWQGLKPRWFREEISRLESSILFQVYGIGKTCECILNPQTTLPVKDIAFLCRSLIRFVPVWGRLVWPRRFWYGIQHRGRHLRCGNWNPSYGEVSFQMPIDYTLLLYRGFKLESGLTVFWNVLNIPKTTRCKDIISIFSCRLKPAIRFNKGGRRWWTDELVFVQVGVQRCENEACNLKSMA